MQEYIADLKEQKYIYRKIRKKYKRWVYGNIGMLLCISLIIVVFLWISDRSGEFTMEVFIVGTAVNLFPFLIGSMCRAWAISGGREITWRKSEKIILSDDSFIMEYVPKRIRIMDPEQICYKIRYSDIKSMEYQEDKMCLKVCGDYQIVCYLRKNLGDSPGNMEITEIIDKPFYLYSYYEHFNECMEQIARKTGINISSSILPCDKSNT